MVVNKLSVSPNKTEYLLFNPKHFNNPNCNITIDTNNISLNNSAKNLGVDISAIVVSRFLQLHDFHRIRVFIPKTAAIVERH